MVMQLRRQAGDVDVIELERQNLAGQGAASDDQDFPRALPAAGVACFGGEFGGRALPATVIPAFAGIQIMRRRRLSQ